MQVILLKDVAKVGRRAEIVTVSEGYALNFLIPKGLARAATPAARRELEAQKAKISTLHQAENTRLEKDIAAIDGKTVTTHARANEQGHLFAALHEDEVAAVIYDQHGISLPKDSVTLSEPIKEAGTYDIKLTGGGKEASVHFVVEPLSKV